MVHLPIFTRLEVTDYRLFPGHPRGSGIRWQFPNGLTLIAGINGLGKTTLITMILRCLTGPYDLTSDGMPATLDVVLPRSPVSLRRKQARFFADRVADGAVNAQASLSATIGDTQITISRRLDNLSLTALCIDGNLLDIPTSKAGREELIQTKLTELFGLGDFVDVLLVLHHIVLFLENRPGALWDTNAQRQLLRTLCLPKEAASEVAELERLLQSADSQARNVHARLRATERDLTELKQREAETVGLLAQLEAEQAVLDAEIIEANRLEALLDEHDTERKNARLELERAKIEREEAVGAVERLKYTALSRYFPSMDEVARLVLSRIMTDGRCLVCSSDAEETQLELESRIERGNCPVCGADPKEHDAVIPSHVFEQANLERARERVERAYREEETRSRRLRGSVHEYESTLDALSQVRQSFRDRESTARRLRARLAPEGSVREYEGTLSALETQLRRWQATRAARFRQLESLLRDRQSAILERSNLLLTAFQDVARTLLVENIRLAQVKREPRYLQAPGHDRIEVPAFVAEMEAADRPGFVRRIDPNEVSESQREIIDLAFRLALMQVFFGTSTFVMETPEASLDPVSMERIGRTLHDFSAQGNNRLILTSNLTNMGIISELFGGPAPQRDTAMRLDHVLDLMQIAAPNLALQQDGERYRELLDSALLGVN